MRYSNHVSSLYDAKKYTARKTFFDLIRENPRESVAKKFFRLSHPIIIRSAATFRRDPSNDLVWIGNVTGFTMHAVRRIQADAFSVGLAGIVHHLVNICRAEILAGAAEFFYAARVANVSVVNHQVSRLVFFMPSARVVEVGKFVESKLAITLGGTDQMSFGAAVRRKFR
jgi:hypothetical protein